MKYLIARWLVALLPVCLLLSCNKSKSLTGSASLTIVNAVAGTQYLVPNFSGTDSLSWYGGATLIVYNDTTVYDKFSGYSGNQPLALYQYNDTLPKSVPLFNLLLDLPVGSIHTLFLAGTIAKPDTLFTTDNPPYHPASDSSVGIRFVNLSPGSSPVSVNIQGAANGSEVANLPYKGITAFKIYAAGSAVSSYTFEFRDMSSGVLLGTTSMYGVGSNTGTNIWRYRNYTIAIDGLPGIITGPTAQTLFRINNF
jgi:hypothetical protein